MIRLPNKVKGTLAYLGAFCLPILYVMVMLWLTGLFPFGQKSLTIWDLRIQYVDFFTWYKNALTGDASLLYSFSKSLGGNTWGIFAYYLSSPLNLLVLFFPASKMGVFVVVLTCLKFGLCGLTCQIFLRKRFGQLPAVFSIAISVCYALMQYTLTQASNIMWLEGAIMLPLVMLGIYRLVQKQTGGLLFVSILLAILSCWYTGYMICLFAVLYYLYEEAQYQRFSLVGKSRQAVGRFVRFGAVGLAAGSASAVFLLPTVLSLLSGKGGVEEEWWKVTFRFPVLSVFKGLFIGNYDKEAIPALYCGLLVLLLAMLYFLNRRISFREKVAAGVFLSFMLFSTCFRPLENIWNGMRAVYSYYCRFSFLISFLLIYMAARSLSEAAGLTPRRIGVTVGSLAGIALLCDFVKGFPSRLYLYLSVGILLMFAALLHLLLKRWKSGGKTRLVTAAILVLVAVELFIDTRSIFQAIYKQAPVENYGTYYDESTAQLKALRGMDDGLYRIEKTYNRLTDKNNRDYVAPTTNEGMAMGYMPLSHYSSTYDKAVTDMMIRLGYSMDNQIISIYTEPILLSDSLLGVKYVSSETCPLGFVSTDLPATAHGQTFYRNPYALPLGYRTAADVLEPVAQQDNPFLYQNAMLSAVLGRKVECFKPLDAHPEEREGERLWRVEAPAGQPVYGYLHAPGQGTADLYIDDEWKQKYYYWFAYNVFSVGEFATVHQAEIRVEGSINEQAEHTAYFYYLDKKVLESAIKELAATGFEPEELRDGYLSGSYRAEEDGLLLLTIPYDEGWTITVGGKTVKPEKAWGALTAIPVQAGDNVIAMRYTLPGLKAGAVLSVVGLGGFGIWMLVRRRRLKRRQG